MPGDPAIERRVRSLIRWNAIAMVLRATRSPPSSAATSRATSRPRRSTRSASTTSGTRRPRSTVATCLHTGALLAGHLRARLPRGPDHRGGARGLPPGGLPHGGICLLPAPVADARLLAVPDRLDGARADHGDLPGALHALPHRPRASRTPRAQGLGLHGRRRDRRARVARRDRARRPRAARQPRLRRQLQPAAPRRPGPRQRQDHPGAGDDLPRRRLERDQGDLGRPLGPAAGGRRGRPPRAPDGGGGRRRVPGLQGARRRLRARALLRRSTRSWPSG